MKTITREQIKKNLIKIINKSNIEEVIYEPSWLPGYEGDRILVGSVITITTSLKKEKNEK